jgi:hypothetical protein
MNTAVWNEAALRVATYIRTNNFSFNRGSLLIPLPNDEVVAWLFGSRTEADQDAEHGLGLILGRIGEAGLEELGHGLSHDGFTWAVAIKSDGGRFRTGAGKAFHLELLQLTVSQVLGGGSDDGPEAAAGSERDARRPAVGPSGPGRNRLR